MATPRPEPNNPAYRTLMNFLDCLTEESLFYILHLPKTGALKPDQYAALRRIYQHFDKQDSEAQSDIPSSSNFDQDLTVGDEENLPIGPGTPQSVATDPKKPGPGRPRKFPGGTSTPSNVTNKSWGPILAMQECKLDSILKAQLDANPNNDAKEFLQDPLPSLDGLDGQSKLSIKTFTSFCRQVGPMSKEMAQDRVQWLFLELLVGDMATLLFGAKGLSKKRDLKASIISVEDERAWEDIESTVRIAKKLEFICGRLGNGCIFWLHGELTKNFLLNRVTEKGEAYDEAMELLHCLGLREKVAERGAKLGDAIRAHLQNFYHIEHLISDEKDVIDASSDEQSMMET